jgi:hypothetical protein
VFGALTLLSSYSEYLDLRRLWRPSGAAAILLPGSVSSLRDIRQLLITGAITVVRWAIRNGASMRSRLVRMVARKPRFVVAIVPANKMALRSWRCSTKVKKVEDGAGISQIGTRASALREVAERQG